MSEDHYEEILNILVKFKEDTMGKVLKYPTTGICYATERAITHLACYGTWAATCGDAFSGWSRFSGDRRYPVPSPDKHMTPKEYYQSTLDKWVGEYGKLRMELLDHLIEWYSERIN